MSTFQMILMKLFLALNAFGFVFVFFFIVQGIIFFCNAKHGIIAERVLGIKKADTIQIAFLMLAIILFVTINFGYYAAKRGNKILLFVYTGIMVLIVIGFTVNITSNVNSNEEEALKALKYLYRTYTVKSESREAIDVLQKALSCCGYINEYSFEKVPPSCCAKEHRIKCTPEHYFKKSCKEAFKYVSKYINYGFSISLYVPFVLMFMTCTGFLVAIYGFTTSGD